MDDVLEYSVGQSGDTQFPHLLSPVKIGNLNLQNRMVMGAMHTRLETMDLPLEREIAFYRARAEGGIGLIISGGFSPNKDGLFEPGALAMSADLDLAYQRELCTAIAGTGTPFFIQLLHAGRYSKFSGCVGASEIPSPINRYRPRRLSENEAWATISDFGRAAELACDCGYAGIEIMGSEGYLINQFLAARTNDRDDDFGGSAAKRMRFAIEVVKTVRKSIGNDIPLIFRISALELVEGGMAQKDILSLAALLEGEGVDCINTGIGWHESRVPTVAYVTPRAAFAKQIAAIRDVVDIPVIASNRINDPHDAERLIADGTADLVSLARQMLADPEFVRKCASGADQSINTCIACNQACLDKVFVGAVPTCLVNPRALREVEFPTGRADTRISVAIVGGGAAGMTCAAEAAARGHRVTLFEKSARLGGLLNLARQVPDKSEFGQLLRYLQNRLVDEGVVVELGSAPTVSDLIAFNRVVVATGVRPRIPAIPGIDHPKVAIYDDILSGKREAGKCVAILGAGGIGFDVAEFLLFGGARTPKVANFAREFGLRDSDILAGGFASSDQKYPKPLRTITMLQRSPGRLGRTLSITTDWIKRARLSNADVKMLKGVAYRAIDDNGLHIDIDGQPRTINAETIVICTGQMSERTLADELETTGVTFDLIGGANIAGELNAMRAIDEATRLAVTI